MKTHNLQNNYADRVGRATEVGLGDSEWNNRFLACLGENGLKLAPYREGVHLGETGPLMAPLPCPGAENPFPYPSVIVEADDERDYTTDPEPRYEARGPFEADGPCAVVHIYRDGYHRRCTRFVAIVSSEGRDYRQDARIFAQALATHDDITYLDRTRP